MLTRIDDIKQVIQESRNEKEHWGLENSQGSKCEDFQWKIKFTYFLQETVLQKLLLNYEFILASIQLLYFLQQEP